MWNLETNETYKFRVRAENRYGKSDPCETEEVQITDPFGLPGPPEKPKITDYCKTSMTLTWEPPRDNGGSMIIGYWLEKREKGTDYWARVNKMPITKRGIKGWEYQVSFPSFSDMGSMPRGHMRPQAGVSDTTSVSQVTRLIEGTEYEFRVAASNSAGIGPFSSPSDSAFAVDPLSESTGLEAPPR